MIWLTGGETKVRGAVIAACGEAELDVHAVSRTGTPEPSPGDAMIDLGLPPRDWPARALAEAEVDRVGTLARTVPDGVRIVRASILGAAPDAPTELQRAQAAAEDAWRSAASAVALRVGVLLGDCGLAGALCRLVERSFLVSLPGVARSKLEPLLVDDFARYCVEAAVTPGPLDDLYDLGCGEILTCELLAKGLADNLGVRRWVIAVPGKMRLLAASALARAEFPGVAVRRMLETLGPGLLPRRMSAWEAFAVKPTDLRVALAIGAGMKYPLRKRDDDRFGSWHAPERKGILWTKGGGRKRR